MGAAKYAIRGSGYIGVFATANDTHLFIGSTIKESSKKLIGQALKAEPVELTIFGTELVGLFMRANSNGAIISNLIEDHELAELKRKRLGINIAVIDSNLNALGNNIIANDKVAIVSRDYDAKARKQITDVLGVEVLAAEIGGFKTIGANNILTNRGFIINNRATDEEKEQFDRATGLESVRTTANTGSLNIGLSTIANSTGVVVGDETTGYEMARIIDGLDIKD